MQLDSAAKSLSPFELQRCQWWPRPSKDVSNFLFLEAADQFVYIVPSISPYRADLIVPFVIHTGYADVFGKFRLTIQRPSPSLSSLNSYPIESSSSISQNISFVHFVLTLLDGSRPNMNKIWINKFVLININLFYEFKCTLNTLFYIKKKNVHASFS